MTYKETTEYLFNCAPLFQHVGGDAYKEGLSNTYILDKHFGHPHRNFRTIHVGGTNGKGSCSHTLAAILQSAGYKTGLYTSPHLIDFSERIRINGEPISETYIIEFVERERTFFEPLHPSFFELTTALAFKYFADNQVDVAIIEVGLGGRLDCTNIIQPDLSIITNISHDHTQFLGNTLTQIATEKAGIIKHGTPVIIGEQTEKTRQIFINKATEMGASLCFADESDELISVKRIDKGFLYKSKQFGEIIGELGGLYQTKNTATILEAIKQLQKNGYKINTQNIQNGFADVCRLTGLMGRWQTLNKEPLIICDTGHNIGGISYIVQQLMNHRYQKLHFVIGMVNDKDIDGILSLLPQEATYYFTKAFVRRALPEQELQKKAANHKLIGNHYPTVSIAMKSALCNATEKDLIFVGGSSFIVADLLKEKGNWEAKRI